MEYWSVGVSMINTKYPIIFIIPLFQTSITPSLGQVFSRAQD